MGSQIVKKDSVNNVHVGVRKRKRMFLNLGLLICHLEASCYTSHGKLFSLLYFLIFASQYTCQDDRHVCWWSWVLSLVDLLSITASHRSLKGK